MMTTTRRRSARPSFTLSAFGLRETRRADVKAGHGYFLGASDRPRYVLVLAVGDMVRYCGSYDLTPQVLSRAVFEDLVATAGDTVQRTAEQYRVAAESADASTASGRLAKAFADATARDAASHGAPVNFADYDRVECVVTAPQGADVYGLGKNFGVVGNWDDAANRVSVECDRSALAQMPEAGLTIESVRVLKECPTA